MCPFGRRTSFTNSWMPRSKNGRRQIPQCGAASVAVPFQFLPLTDPQLAWPAPEQALQVDFTAPCLCSHMQRIGPCISQHLYRPVPVMVVTPPTSECHLHHDIKARGLALKGPSVSAMQSASNNKSKSSRPKGLPSLVCWQLVYHFNVYEAQ